MADWKGLDVSSQAQTCLADGCGPLPASSYGGTPSHRSPIPPLHPGLAPRSPWEEYTPRVRASGTTGRGQLEARLLDELAGGGLLGR